MDRSLDPAAALKATTGADLSLLGSRSLGGTDVLDGLWRTEQCLVRMREKGETERWQPISPTLMAHLLLHHEERGLDGPQRIDRTR